MTARRELQNFYDIQQASCEYAAAQTAEMRCRLGKIPYIYPRNDKFPVKWNVVNGLVYNFLETLGLKNTLAVFATEADMKNTQSMMESGWFLKSFIMHPDFHSVLMYLLNQFDVAHDRIKAILEEHCQGVNVQATSGSGVCGSQSCRDIVTSSMGHSVLADSVRERLSSDMEKTIEAQETIQEQRDSDHCMKERAIREEEERIRYEMERLQKESQCKEQQESANSVCGSNVCAEDEKRKREEEECRRQQACEEQNRLRVMQEDVASRALDIVCQQSRHKILESIRQQHAQEDAQGSADVAAHRANIQRERECNKIVEEENNALEKVLANTRKKILENMFASEEDITNATCQALSEAQSASSCAGSVDNYNVTRNPDDLAAMAQKFGFDRSHISHASRRRSTGNRRNVSRAADPRMNQSFRTVHRNQHTGWKIEPLGDLGCGQEPEIVVTEDVDNVVVIDPESDECSIGGGGEEEVEVCDHEEPRYVARATRPSRIPRYHQVQSPEHHHHHSSFSPRRGVSTERSSLGSGAVARHSVGPQTCGCRNRAREDRSAADYVHFSRRQPSRRRNSMGGVGVRPPMGGQGGMDCIAEL